MLDTVAAVRLVRLSDVCQGRILIIVDTVRERTQKKGKENEKEQEKEKKNSKNSRQCTSSTVH